MADVPYVRLDAQNTDIEDEILDAVRSVIRHGNYINGPEVAEFERQMAAFIGVDHVVGVNSGTDALILAMRAHGIGPGDEVITVSHTYFSSVTSIMMVGARPVLVDVDEETMVISPTAVEQAISSKTRAVIAVHLNGYACDLDALGDLCRRHGVILIEDVAQAFGATFRGKQLGSQNTGCFSMHPLKVLAALGDAGFVTTNDVNLATTLRQLRSLGHVDRDHIGAVSGNARLDTLHAAILLKKLKHVPTYIDRRREHEAAYRKELRNVRLPPHDSRIQAVSCPFVIRHPRRNELMEGLLQAGIDVKIHYPIPTHRQLPLQPYGPFHLPVSEQVIAEILSLPSSGELTAEERARVIETVNEVAESLVET
ncbi:MAG: DegT/DnrJ/EryC1/StrS family aminotransferase [bacterium]